MSNSFSKKVGYEHTKSQDLGGSPQLTTTRRHSDAMLLAVYHGRLSRSEFHEGQVPLKASGSCSWCWYSSRHIQRVVNIFLCTKRKKKSELDHDYDKRPTPIHGTASARACSADSPASGGP